MPVRETTSPARMSTMTIWCLPKPACNMATNRPEGCTAMFTGKSPNSICRPAGCKDHWFGNCTEPSARLPGQPERAAASEEGGTSPGSEGGRVVGTQAVPPRIIARLSGQRILRINCADGLPVIQFIVKPERKRERKGPKLRHNV